MLVRALLSLALIACGCGELFAGPIVLPSDIAVDLEAEPTSNLRPGDRIAFTISITNNGPDPVSQLTLRSSSIYDELDVETAVIDCDYNLVLAVADTGSSFYYLYYWFAVWPDDPLEVGETRDCSLGIEYTPWAPHMFPVTFDMRDFTDLDPSNNAGTIVLRGAIPSAPPTAVPSSSPRSLLLLGMLLTTIGCFAHSRLAPYRARKRNILGR